MRDLAGFIEDGVVGESHRPAPLVGFCLIAVATLPGVFMFETSVVPMALLAGAATFAFASSVPSDVSLVAVAVTGPVLLSVSYTEPFGWTAYTDVAGTNLMTGVEQAPRWFESSGVASLVTIGVCAIAAWMLMRRGRAGETARIR